MLLSFGQFTLQSTISVNPAQHLLGENGRDLPPERSLILM